MSSSQRVGAQSVLDEAVGEQAKTAIAHLAVQCEQALKCAAFADDNREFYARGMGDSLRRCAVLHSDQAWRWVDSLRSAKGGEV